MNCGRSTPLQYQVIHAEREMAASPGRQPNPYENVKS
jgi:hypothetical protein